jgi:peptidoglycan hydrolase-like protein with peptidoglycan-binding domain
LYLGPIDGIYGPQSARALRRFQRQAGLTVDGRLGPSTRRALGPLGRPMLGRRTLYRAMFGWDVSILQYLLARRRPGVTINGYFGPRTERRLRSFQHAHGLVADGIAGPRTLAVLLARTRHRGVARPAANPIEVRSLIGSWAKHYGVDPALVRALAWMESGYQPNVRSTAGAKGVMQILPATWSYVETILIGRDVPPTVSGNIRVGVVFLRELLREFNGNERRALAAWYQGPSSIRTRGPLRATRHFVANVLALKARDV